MALPPPPPPPRPRVAQFSHTKDELNFVVVDRITSIRIIAPTRPANMSDWDAYGNAVWKVRIAMGADQLEREFRARWYFDDGTVNDPFQAFHLAREDAIVFARELTQQINSLLTRER